MADPRQHQGMMKMGYGRFVAMVVVSTIAMFVLMYMSSYALDHVFYSQTRMWMAVVMGATMAIIMLGFMWGMYRNMRVNVVITVVSVIVFGVALWLVRSQETVDDVSYMKAMIPHHSMAILNSERAHIHDPRVRRLADQIIDSQVLEIREMKALISDLERHPIPDGAPDLPSYRDKGVAPPQPDTDESTGINTLQPVD